MCEAVARVPPRSFMDCYQLELKEEAVTFKYFILLIFR